MHFAGHLPEDAPDPRLQLAERVRALAFPVMGLAPQTALEDWGSIAFEETAEFDGTSQQAVSIGYTVWRNRDDPSDPVNFAELDDHTRASLDVEPAWPRPPWILETVDRLRRLQLWEAVRTSWSRHPSDLSSVADQLLHHTNHILMNRFRAELGLPPGPTHDRAWSASGASVNPSVSVLVDGVRVHAAEIDTDPFVYALGARLTPDVVATVVIPRDLLPLVRIELVTRSAPPTGGEASP